MTKLLELPMSSLRKALIFTALCSTCRKFFVSFCSKSLRDGQAQSKVSPEQCVRILDSLREGEDLVKMGLSEKTNFEVTLFRAVESGRSRSIDQVIRRISGMIPDEVKKKT